MGASLLALAKSIYYSLNKTHCKLMREVFLLFKYNLTTLKIYFKQGQKFNFFVK